MIKLELTPEKFLELLNKGYSLDMIYLLKMMELSILLGDNTPRTSALSQSIIRKGLITEEGNITLSGKELLEFLSTSSETKLKRKSKEIDGFDLWWKEFPSTDSFEYKGRKFAGSRALKTKKDECKAKIAKYLNEGEFTIEDLIAAIKLEVNQKKENSYKTGQNKLSYIQNSHTYLLQRSFEGYLELIKAGHKPEEETKTAFNGVEI